MDEFVGEFTHASGFACRGQAPTRASWRLRSRQLLEEAEAVLPVRMKDSTARPRVTDRYSPITAQRLWFRMKGLGFRGFDR